MIVKKYILILTILIICINFISVSAVEPDFKRRYEMIVSFAPYLMDDGNIKISRSDCVVALMRFLGAYETFAYGTAYMVDYDHAIFDDVPQGIDEGYLIMARRCNVIYGVSKNFAGVCKFDPNRDVTIKECLAFMLRCLKDHSTVIWENIVSDSVRIGLLSKDDADSLNFDAELTGAVFRRLLLQMLSMPRYIYWEQNGMIAWEEWEEKDVILWEQKCITDKTGEITYYDWISAR